MIAAAEALQRGAADRSAPVLPRKASAEAITWVPSVQAADRPAGARWSRSITHRNAARLRGAADRRDEIRESGCRPAPHRIAATSARRRPAARPRRGPDVAARGDGLLAGRIDQDQRHRGGAARYAHARRCNRCLRGRDRRQMRSLTSSSWPPSGPAKGHAPAQPRDRDRGVGGAAAAGDDEIRCLHLGAGAGKFFDPHDDVLHRDAGAEDLRGCLPCSVSQSRSRPPPRRG